MFYLQIIKSTRLENDAESIVISFAVGKVGGIVKHMFTLSVALRWVITYIS